MNLKKISSKTGIKESDKCDGYLIQSSESEARKIIASLKDKSQKKIIALIGGEDNRRAVETLKINYLVSPEKGNKKDTLKQRDSGLNHVVAKEAAKRNIPIVIDFDEIKSLKGKAKALRLEKIIQNIKICRRAKCQIKIWDLSNNTDDIALKAFGTSLGMSSVQAADSIKL